MFKQWCDMVSSYFKTNSLLHCGKGTRAGRAGAKETLEEALEIVQTGCEGVS